MKPETIRNAQVNVLANIFFNGAVQSRTYHADDGRRRTLGVILPGEYAFDTHEAEVVEITRGGEEILLPGETAWRTIGVGESYTVPAHSSFRVKCATITEYICTFL